MKLNAGQTSEDIHPLNATDLFCMALKNEYILRSDLYSMNIYIYIYIK